MKRILALTLTFMVVCTTFLGCADSGSDTPQLMSGETLESVFTAIEADFLATHGEEAVMMAAPSPLDDTLMTDLIGIDLEMVEDYYAVMAGMMPGFSEFIAVKATEGNAATIAEKLTERKATLESQYETYPVMGNYDRAKNAEVYTKGDYVFLIAIGAASNDGTSGTYTEDVAAAKAVIDSKFE